MSSFGKGFEPRDDDTVVSRELGLQGVSARPLAILPILPGSIAPARAPTPRHAKLKPASIRFACGARHNQARGRVPLALGMLTAASPARNRVDIAAWRK